MEFTELNINDKKLFDEYFKLYNPQESELNFTNLFMWRNYYNIKYSVIDGFLCIFANPKDDEPFAFFPAGDLNKNDVLQTLNKMKEYFLFNKQNLLLKRVPENQLKYINKIIENSEDVQFDLNNSDYVYKTEDLISLKGKKYDGKRNHINNFQKLYEFEYKIINEMNLNECSKIMDKWCAERTCEEHSAFYCEKLANIELINNYSKLECKGAMIKVDGEYEAFTIGEMLNKDTAVIHIEKAVTKIRGLYSFINKAFAENEWHEVEYINREQDLGVEGLRKSKNSYHPEKLIKKYKIKLC